MPIKKCFRRSMAFFACHNVLIFVETILFSIPIFVFKNDIDNNPTKWSGYFVWIVGLQIDLLIANVFVIPPILGGLAYFYFAVKGHPWARILKRELAQEEEEDIEHQVRVHHTELNRVASEGTLIWEDEERINPNCKTLKRSKSHQM